MQMLRNCSIKDGFLYGYDDANEIVVKEPVGSDFIEIDREEIPEEIREFVVSQSSGRYYRVEPKG